MGESIVTTVTTALKSFASGVADVVVSTFNAVVANEDGTGVSNIAVWGLTFLAIGLGIRIVNKFTGKAG